MIHVLSSFIAAGILALGSILPAHAQYRSDTCYFETSRQAFGNGREISCRYAPFTTSSGIRGTHVIWADGEQSSYSFFGNGRVHIRSRGASYFGSWVTDSDKGLTIIFHDSNAVTGLPFYIY